MSVASREFLATIRTLTVLTKRESQALASLNFKLIAELMVKKSELEKRLETVIARNENPIDSTCERELAELRALSADNLRRLEKLRDSVTRARARIAALASATRSPGVYGAHSRSLLARPPAIGKNV